jgi:hypothetical protein
MRSGNAYRHGARFSVLADAIKVFVGQIACFISQQLTITSDRNLVSRFRRNDPQP